MNKHIAFGLPRKLEESKSKRNTSSILERLPDMFIFKEILTYLSNDIPTLCHLMRTNKETHKTIIEDTELLFPIRVRRSEAHLFEPTCQITFKEGFFSIKPNNIETYTLTQTSYTHTNTQNKTPNSTQPPLPTSYPELENEKKFYLTLFQLMEQKNQERTLKEINIEEVD